MASEYRDTPRWRPIRSPGPPPARAQAGEGDFVGLRASHKPSKEAIEGSESALRALQGLSFPHAHRPRPRKRGPGEPWGASTKGAGEPNNGLPPAQVDSQDVGRAKGAREVGEDPFRTSGKYSDSEGTLDLLYLNPEFEDFLGAHHTPSLRNIAATAPYGHAGQFASLQELLSFYKKLPRVPILGHRDMILKPLGKALSVPDMTAFLSSLTGPLPDGRWLAAPSE